jgi:hypothetical protein
VRGESDQDKRNHQPSWFYFRMQGVARREITIDLTGFRGEYNYRSHDGSGHRNTHPVFSFDGKTWRHFQDTEWIAETATIRLRIRPEGDRLWIARQPPYTDGNLRALLRDISRHKDFQQETYGGSVGGRPLLLFTITDQAVPVSGKKVIWLLARQHSWESGTSYVAEGLLRRLLGADAEAARLRRDHIFKVMIMADPDGVARGGVRYNANGYDLNRNWDAIDAKLMPEIAAQHRAIMHWLDSGGRIDLFLTLHNTESADYIAGRLSAGGPDLQALGQRFWTLLDRSGMFHSPGGARDTAASTTAGKKGRMDVVQALFAQRKIPAFVMEQMVDFHPRLKRWPTVEDRMKFGAALAAILTTALKS